MIFFHFQKAPISTLPGFDSNGVAVSDLSSWDSTEEEVNIPDTSNNQSYGFGMKHSEGMMDLSKVLSDNQDEHQQEFVPAASEHILINDEVDADRIYDSVENLTSKGLELQNDPNEIKEDLNHFNNSLDECQQNIFNNEPSFQQDATINNVHDMSNLLNYSKMSCPKDYHTCLSKCKVIIAR